MIPVSSKDGSTPFGLGGLESALALLILTVMLVIAVYMELKERRIPNWLTFSGMLLGLLLALARGGGALGSAGLGLAVGFGFLFAFYVFGGVGGGDVKLMGAAGALMGVNLILPAMMYTALFGALIAIFMVVWHRDFWERMIWQAARLAFWRPSCPPRPPPAAPSAVPYGIAIAAGCLLAILVRSGL